MTDLLTALRDFNKDRKFNRKGPLCVALVVTQHARKMGLPLDPDKLLTDAGGQVLGLGKGAVQAVLNRHGITRVLAAEGGRTSRGSISNMREYVAFLNGQAAGGAVDLDAVEAFWIERVHEFFSAKPFKIRLDASRSLRTLVRDVIAQAEESRCLACQSLCWAGTTRLSVRFFPFRELTPNMVCGFKLARAWR